MSYTFEEKLNLPVNEIKAWVNIFPKIYLNKDLGSYWTLHSGSIYYADISGFYCDGSCNVYEDISTTLNFSSPTLLSYVQDVSSITSPGEYTFDLAQKRIYLRSFNSVNPNTRSFTIEHKLFDSTNAGHYPAVPNNTNYQYVYYEGNTVKLPQFNQSLSDVQFGYIPVSVSQYISSNTGHYWDKYLYSSSFKNARINVYQDFNGPTLIIQGLIDSFNIDENQISFSIKSLIGFLDRTYNLPGILSISGGISVNSQDTNNFIRKIYGKVYGFVGTNIDYSQTATTSNNRKWVLSKDPVSAHPQITCDVLVPSANNTNTTTQLVSATGLCAGDSIVLQQAGLNTYDVFITSINYSTNVITHTNIPGRTAAAGDKVFRGFVGNVIIINPNGAIFSLSYLRDWVEVDNSGYASITLTNNFENVYVLRGMTSPFDPNTHEILFNVYGTKTVPQKPGGGNLGSVSPIGGAYSNPFGICYDLISEAIRPEYGLSIIDGVSFSNQVNSTVENVGFAIPESSNGQLVTYKDVMINLLNSCLGRIFITNTINGPKFSINRVGPSGAPLTVIDSNEIVSFSYSHNYEDAPNKIKINTNLAESKLTVALPISLITFAANNSYDDGKVFFYFKGEEANNVYLTQKDLEINTYLWDAGNFASSPLYTLVKRIAYFLRQRKGFLNLSLKKNIFLLADIGDTIEVKRESLPGFEFIFGAENSRKFVIIEKTQGTGGIEIVCDDNKSADDFSGVW